MKRLHKPKSKPYRPFFGEPYRYVLWLIAEELNKTSLNTFDDLAAGRHAVFELWKRMFPKTPFPADADILRTPYYKDPAV